jgi:hypothetical protein
MPQLDVHQPIADFDVVKALAHGHPVFMLACIDDGSYLVIKQERQFWAPVGGERKAMNHNLKAMAEVSPTVAGSKALIPQEVAVLNLFVRASEGLSQTTNYTEPADVALLRTFLLGSGPWFKMSKAEGVIDLKSAIEDAQVRHDKTGLRAIAQALNALGGFERLGRIVAIDLYNNNLDRFNWFNAGDWNPWSATNAKFKTIGNLGNVLLALEKGALRPVGLDSFDSQSEYSDVGQTIDVLETGKTGPKELWGGNLLARDARDRRKRFAQDIFDDLQDALWPRHRWLFFPNKRRLDKNGPQRILRGMDLATNTLRGMLQQKLSKSSPPQGLASRLAVLGA